MPFLALFGYEQGIASAWVERLVVFLMIIPWAAALMVSRGGRRGRWATGTLTMAVLLLIDRLRWDPRLWSTIACVVAGLLAAMFLRSEAGGIDGRRARSSLSLGWLLAGSVLAAWAMWVPNTRAAAWPAVAFALIAIVAVLSGSAKLGAETVCCAGWTGLLLATAAGGLSRQNLVMLLIGGSVGWLWLQFLLWRAARREGRAGSGLSRAAGAMATVFAAATCLEVYFRYVYDYSDANGELRTCANHLRRHVRFNRLGFRDREFPEPSKLPEGPRVVVLGDSFAFGIGIREYADMLGPQLEAAMIGTGWSGSRVFTIAKGGIDTRAETSLFEKFGEPLSPHVVVLCYHVNDIDDTQHAPMRSRWLEVLSPLSASSDAFEFFEWRVYTLCAPSLPAQVGSGLGRYQDAEAFAAHAARVRNLVEVIRRRGAKPLAVLYPYLDAPTHDGPQRIALDRMAELFGRMQVPVVDTSRVVEVSEGRYHANRFDPHPSAELHRAVVPELVRMVGAVPASRPGDSLPAISSAPAASRGDVAVPFLAAGREAG